MFATAILTALVGAVIAPLENDAQKLFVTRGGPKGYMDRTGTIVIPGRFTFANTFSEGLAAVTVSRNDGGNGKWGYIDRTGNYVLRPQFRSGGNFHEGRAYVGFENGRLGYIDRAGNRIGTSDYDACENFQDGVALVGRANIIGRYTIMLGESHEGHCRYTYIDVHGVELGNAAFKYGAAGLPPLPLKKGWLQGWGYVDADGEFVIPPRFDRAERFAEGLALVQVGKNFGFIDKRGEFVIQPTLPNAFSFHEGRAVALDPGTRLWGALDQRGAWAIAPTFRRLHSFSEGLAAFQDSETEKYGFVDTSGAVRIEARYDTATFFQNGLALVMSDKKWVHVSKDGTIVQPKR